MHSLCFKSHNALELSELLASGLRGSAQEECVTFNSINEVGAAANYETRGTTGRDPRLHESRIRREPNDY